MKMDKLLLCLLIIIFINSSEIPSEKSYINLLRNLWENNIEYTKRTNEDDNYSLKHCSRSSAKYFSYILSGAPFFFEHYINEGNAVSNMQ